MLNGYPVEWAIPDYADMKLTKDTIKQAYFHKLARRRMICYRHLTLEH